MAGVGEISKSTRLRIFYRIIWAKCIKECLTYPCAYDSFNGKDIFQVLGDQISK